MKQEWEELKDMGNEEYKKKNYNSAISIYTNALSLNPESDILYANRALSLISLKKIKQAFYDLQKAINLNPRNLKALKRLANLQVSQGNFGEAIQLVKRCINLEPKEYSHEQDLKNINNLIKEQEALNKAKEQADIPKIEEICDKLLVKCTEYGDLKKDYLYSLLKQNKFNPAFNFINTKLNSEELNNEDFLYITSLTFYYDGKYEKAKEIVKSVISRSSDSPRFQRLWSILKVIVKEKEKANEAFKNGDIDKAIEMYTELLNLDPDNAPFCSTMYSNRALCYQKRSKLMEALGDANKAIELNNTFSKAYLRRGNVNMALKNFEEAKYDYQKVKDLDPSNRDIQRLIEEAKKEEKKAKKKDYYKILEIESNADDAAIRKAYKRLAVKYHPDKNSGTPEQASQAEKAFKDVNEAFQVLSDPKKRQMFDSGINPDDPNSGMGFHGDPNEIFQMFFGGNMGSSRSNIQFDFGENSGFSNSFFGNGRQGKQSNSGFNIFFQQ